MNYSKTLFKFLVFLLRVSKSNDDAKGYTNEPPPFPSLTSETSLLIADLESLASNASIETSANDEDEGNGNEEEDTTLDSPDSTTEDIDTIVGIIFKVLASIIYTKYNYNLDNSKSNITFVFLAHLHINSDGTSFDSIHKMTSYCAHLEFIFKGVVVLDIMEVYSVTDVEDRPTDDKEVLEYQKEKISYVVLPEVGLIPTPFSKIVDLHSAASNNSASKLPNVVFQTDDRGEINKDEVSINGKSFSLSKTSAGYHKLMNNLSSKVTSTLSHFGNIAVPSQAELFKKMVNEDLNDISTTSLVTGRSNHELLNHDTFLLNLLLELCSKESVHALIKGGDLKQVKLLQFDSRKTRKFLKAADDLRLDFFSAIHLSCPPSRTTELAILQHRNSEGDPTIRNFFYSSNRILLLLRYNKTNSILNSEKLIFKYLPLDLSYYILLFLAYIQPAVEYLSLRLASIDSQRVISTFFFAKSDGDMISPVKLRLSFNQMMNEYCHLNISISEYRQVHIIFFFLTI
jgi:hypothetical protein